MYFKIMLSNSGIHQGLFTSEKYFIMKENILPWLEVYLDGDDSKAPVHWMSEL